MGLITFRSTPLIATVPPSHRQQISLPVTDASHVNETRRRVAERTTALRFSKLRAGEAANVATEMAGNIVKHGGGGELLLRTIAEDDSVGIELVALDRGRGMDLGRCLVDGFSTAGSPGTGLGAIRRLSAEADFYSVPDRGSAVLALIWSDSPPPASAFHCVIGGLNIPLPPYEVCGDAWAVSCHGERIDVMMADGLGHGPVAALAAQAAVTTFAASQSRSAGLQLQVADDALRAMRGAAMGVAIIEPKERRIVFAGVGNIAGAVLAPESTQHLVSFGGIVGQGKIQIRELTSRWSSDSILIVHSDGVTSRWNVDDYPGLSSRHPSIIAAVLYRDFSPRKDDASILVVKAKP